MNLKKKIRISLVTVSLLLISFSCCHNKPKLYVDTYTFKPFWRLEAKLRMMESRNTIDTINLIGCMGFYQFKLSTLRGLGFYKDKEDKEAILHFTSHKETQLKALKSYWKWNHRVLKKTIKKYDGCYIDGVRITESGILAAAHLGGVGGVLAYFNRGVNRTDGGTTIEKRMKLFSGYNLEL